MATYAQITNMVKNATVLMNTACLNDNSSNSAYTALKTAINKCTTACSDTGCADPTSCTDLRTMMTNTNPPPGVTPF